MEPDELRKTLERVGWYMPQLAQFLDCHEKTVRQMANGERQIPPAVARWLTSLVRWHDQHPPPDDWRSQPNLAAPPKQRKRAHPA